MTILLLDELPRDLTRAYSYITTEEKTEQAMYLYREGRFGRSACIPLSCIHKYDEPHRQTEQLRVETARIIIGMQDFLGLPLTKATGEKLLMFIQDGIEELLKMPPPPMERKVIGEAVLHCNGERTTKEILD